MIGDEVPKTGASAVGGDEDPKAPVGDGNNMWSAMKISQSVVVRDEDPMVRGGRSELGSWQSSGQQIRLANGVIGVAVEKSGDRRYGFWRSGGVKVIFGAWRRRVERIKKRKKYLNHSYI